MLIAGSTDATSPATDGLVAAPGPGCPTSAPMSECRQRSRCKIIHQNHAPTTMQVWRKLVASDMMTELVPPMRALILEGNILVHTGHQDRGYPLQRDVVAVLVIRVAPLGGALAKSRKLVRARQPSWGETADGLPHTGSRYCVECLPSA